jgi:hypothetical protein
MNEERIGEIAGDVWRYLEKSGGRAELTSVRSNVRQREGVTPEVGIGWLAREGKLQFTVEQGTTQLELRR